MKSILFLLSVICLAFTAKAQVNGYASISSMEAAHRLTISTSNETYDLFRKNDVVIVMQVQDNVIGTNVLNNINFGNLATLASAGEYEIAIISTVKRNDLDLDDDDDDNNNPILEIKLRTNLSKTFVTGPNSSVQVITFPTLGSTGFITTANITALPWNGSYGGVVAFQVDGALTLNHNITADNAGFKGGVMDASSSPYGACNSSVYFTGTHDLFGNKGEGIYKSTNPLFAAGKGKILNGGGGGNTINGGGSGGGNFSAGGNGGAGWSCASNTGGLGGIALNSYISTNRFFLGGGGGSGESNDFSNDKGGNGGGIIIIKATEINTVGAGSVRISANGETGNSVSNDGAGGGGAGGSIALQVTTWNVAASKPLQITANGGQGGNVNNGATHGGGGGGGQGAILFSSVIPTFNVISNTLIGTGGYNFTGGTRADDGRGTNNSGIMQNSMGLLPLSLLSFQAYRNVEKVELTWKSQNEINVSRFEIQRSSNGVIFTEIGNRHATNSNQATSSYAFTDVQPLNGTAYYRLRMIDTDGRFTYSKVLIIRESSHSKENIAIYPNPAVAQATLYFKTPHSGLASVRILNSNGALVANQNLKVATGENAVSLAGINHLAAGVYTVCLTVSNTSHYTRLIVQK